MKDDSKTQALTIARDMLYLGTHRVGCDRGPASIMPSPLLALDAKSGRTLWQVEMDTGGFHSAPVVADRPSEETP